MLFARLPGELHTSHPIARGTGAYLPGSRVNKNSPSGHLVPKWHRISVDATLSRRIGVNTTSFLRHLSAGFIHPAAVSIAWI